MLPLKFSWLKEREAFTISKCHVHIFLLYLLASPILRIYYTYCLVHEFLESWTWYVPVFQNVDLKKINPVKKEALFEGNSDSY